MLNKFQIGDIVCFDPDSIAYDLLDPSVRGENGVIESIEALSPSLWLDEGEEEDDTYEYRVRFTASNGLLFFEIALEEELILIRPKTRVKTGFKKFIQRVAPHEPRSGDNQEKIEENAI